METISDPAALFFIDELLPLAEKLADSGKSYFARTPSGHAKTYFASPPQPFATKEKLQIADGGSSAIFDGLQNLWSELGDAELLRLIDPLRRLSAELTHSADNETDGQVTSLAYVLF